MDHDSLFDPPPGAGERPLPSGGPLPPSGPVPAGGPSAFDAASAPAEAGGFPDGSSDTTLDASELSELWGDDDGWEGAEARGAGGFVAEGPAAIVPPPADPDAAFAELQDVVRTTWGFDAFRPLQAEAMRATLAGQDALVVLPTGGGKSLCYQAPALVRDGLTVVVSPLIALMKDQRDGLVSVGVRAAMLTSAQDEEERALVHDALRRRELDILLCSPERMALDGFLDRLVRWGLAAVAIDEAHCISHWGHDFRPEYRKLDRLKRELPDLPVMAFTATAPPNVREDIVAHLGLHEATVLVGDFDRANLTYRVLPRATVTDQIHEVVQRHPGEAGIVYAMRRKDTERIARDLAGRGVRSLPYHAGLEPEERRRVQEQFQGEQVDVIVATVAFGMGIDRPDVRFVVHASLPKGIEQYTQETGRAGRDGLPSECVMFFGGADYHGWKGLMERSAQEAAATGVEGAEEELEANLERLDELWAFACGARCRHRVLVEHFGGSWPETEEGCGACDVCLKELELVPDGQVVAQKILSCIVRCDQRRGAAHVADVLRGADTQRIRQAGHDQLSTHGLLADHRVRDIRAWIDQLISQGHVGVASGEYPTLFLTQDGVALMKGEREVDLYVPAGPARSSTSSRGRKGSLAAIAEAEATGGEVDAGLFESLRTWRRDLAKERGVPPYILFNDRTLALLATQKPTDEAALLGIKGIGAKKAADLGPLVLAHIADHTTSA